MYMILTVQIVIVQIVDLVAILILVYFLLKYTYFLLKYTNLPDQTHLLKEVTMLTKETLCKQLLINISETLKNVFNILRELYYWTQGFVS